MPGAQGELLFFFFLVTAICREPKVTFDDNMPGDQDDCHEDMLGAQDDFCPQR